MPSAQVVVDGLGSGSLLVQAFIQGLCSMQHEVIAALIGARRLNTFGLQAF